MDNGCMYVQFSHMLLFMETEMIMIGTDSQV